MDQHPEPSNENDTVELPPTVSAISDLTGPASSMGQVDLAAATHRGHIRHNNEDHYLTARFGRSFDVLSTNVEEGVLPTNFDETGYGMLVADGIGGMAGGEVASRIALCKLLELVVNTPDWIMMTTQREDMAIRMQRMTQRFRQIDETLREQAEKNRALRGMGTTLTVAVSLASDLLIGHIGDSRAYLLRGAKLHQLTRDHTLAQALIDAGIANHEDSAARAMRHVLTAALGSTGEKVDAEVQRLRLSDGDQVLLCTDGLTEMAKDNDIVSVLGTADTAAQACKALIDLALKDGGIDNVTVALARYRFP